MPYYARKHSSQSKCTNHTVVDIECNCHQTHVAGAASITRRLQYQDKMVCGVGKILVDPTHPTSNITIPVVALPRERQGKNKRRAAERAQGRCRDARNRRGGKLNEAGRKSYRVVVLWIGELVSEQLRSFIRCL